jgi:hypothetical protein
MSDHILLFASVHEDPVDCLVSYVCIVDPLLPDVKVQSNNILQVHFDKSVMAAVRTHIPQVVSVGEDDPWFSLVPSFADMTIQFSLVIGFVTLAVVGSRSVVTVLTTFTFDLRAFVDVFTSFSVFHESIAFIALAVVSGESIDALVFALIQLNFCTFVDMTVSRFVRHVFTIDLFVADSFVGNALSILASKLSS